MVKVMRVFVLLFNVGTDNEAIHTIRYGNAAGEIQNKIIMFESEDDATRYALLLEAQDFPQLAVERLDADEIKEFCHETGYEWEIIPKDGHLAIPPELNVEEDEWELEEQTAGIQDNHSKIPGFDFPDATEPEFSNTDLDDMRRRFEGLL